MATKKMRAYRTRHEIAALLVAGTFAACAPHPAPMVRPVPAPELPAPEASVLRVDRVIVPTQPVSPAQGQSPASTNRITLTATNANVRELLPVLAAAAGISLVMGSDVHGRVSVNLRDVPAMEALRAVIEEAELTVGMRGIPIPFSPVVFYQLPVNINTASAATISERFDVSPVVAEWIVRARLR